MMSRDDVELCARAGVDAVGFIFARGPRCLSIELAEQLTKAVPPFVTSVGVFAGNDPVFITQALQRCRLDVLQFSGGEAATFVGSFGRPTIVVVHAAVARSGTQPARPPRRTKAAAAALCVPSRRQLAVAQAVALLIDTRVDGLAGGTGTRVGNDVAAHLREHVPLPLILAGGLTPDNVAAAAAAVRPWGVDVRSGVERGHNKDYRLVERFVREAKRAGAAFGRGIETVELARPLGGI
ncbi:MAG TPA: phosphoribosylanthranilate isomerase [Candidatus Eremiobacteraceae bacterium]|nr:phosphoribosylanthranilate isomerase [Candidatus Eremiobacteraceae bacterium]